MARAITVPDTDRIGPGYFSCLSACLTVGRRPGVYGVLLPCRPDPPGTQALPPGGLVPACLPAILHPYNRRRQEREQAECMTNSMTAGALKAHKRFLRL